MLTPTPSPLHSFTDSLPPAGTYKLDNASLEIPDPATAIFHAKLIAPPTSSVWARAWLWNDVDNTLAETASDQLAAGDWITLVVKLKDKRVPTHGSIRIESAPLQTEHVITIELPNAKI